MQFDNVLFANWITYCGGYNTTRAMLYDTNPNTLLQHNGDICYAQVSHLLHMSTRLCLQYMSYVE